MVPMVMGLTACAPTQTLTVEEAQQLCARIALDQESNPRVRVGVGLGTGSWNRGYGTIGVSTDSFGRRNPETAYRDCVVRRSGKLPTRPFFEQLGAGVT